jgi:hypothetical protein
MIFGNDYLLTFNDSSELINKRQLHKNIIAFNYGNKKNHTSDIPIHNHLPPTGDFITPTDICTLMLYEKFAKWEQHLVVSKNYISTWDCNKNILKITTK